MADYLAVGSCTLGGYTLKSFVYQAPMGGLTATQVSVLPMLPPGGFSLGIRGPFNGSDQGPLTYLFSYFIDPPPIIREEIDLDPTGNVSLQTVLCAVNTVPCPMANIIGTLNATTNSPMAFTPIGGLTSMSVQDTLTLTGITATSMGFDNITNTVPEPATTLVAAAGLLGLLAFRSRLKFR